MKKEMLADAPILCRFEQCEQYFKQEYRNGRPRQFCSRQCRNTYFEGKRLRALRAKA